MVKYLPFKIRWQDSELTFTVTARKGVISSCDPSSLATTVTLSILSSLPLELCVLTSNLTPG